MFSATARKEDLLRVEWVLRAVFMPHADLVAQGIQGIAPLHPVPFDATRGRGAERRRRGRGYEGLGQRS